MNKLFSDLYESIVQDSTPIKVIKSQKEIIDWVRTNSKRFIEMLSQGNIPTMYRGDRKRIDEAYIRGIPKNRSSANYPHDTSKNLNYLNLLVSEILPSWKDFPKRSESTIVTTVASESKKYAHNDRGVYKVILKDHTKLAICPTRDFWDSFDESIYSKGSGMTHNKINNDIENILLKMEDSDSENPLYVRCNTEAKLLAESLNKLSIDDKYHLDNLNKNLDPYKLGFKLIPASKVNSDVCTDNKECWFSDECLMIQVDSDMDKWLRLNYDKVLKKEIKI